MLRCAEIHVEDSEKAGRFIEKVFKNQRRFEPDGIKDVVFPTGPTLLSFFQTPTPASKSRRLCSLWNRIVTSFFQTPSPAKKTPSVMVCMEVACLETTLADLTEIGTKILEGPSFCGGQRYLVADSECGFLLHVLESVAATSTTNAMQPKSVVNQ